MTATTDALIVALNAENAAIFAYGVVAAHAATSRSQSIAEYTAEHRSRRAELKAALTAAKVQVPAAAPGYNLSAPVTDPVSALTAALTTEEDCAVAYRALIEQAEEAPARRLGLDGLTEVAGRSATWRLALQISPVTVALPGAG